MLDRPDVPCANNASQRGLRPAVIHCRVTGVFLSKGGTTAHVLYRTVEARKRGQNLLKSLYQTLTGINAPALACFS